MESLGWKASVRSCLCVYRPRGLLSLYGGGSLGGGYQFAWSDFLSPETDGPLGNALYDLQIQNHGRRCGKWSVYHSARRFQNHPCRIPAAEIQARRAPTVCECHQGRHELRWPKAKASTSRKPAHAVSSRHYRRRDTSFSL